MADMTEEQSGPAGAETAPVKDRLNDKSAYQQCFACGQRNDIGLRLVFRQDGEAIVTEYTPDTRYQGFPGVVHGGVIATLLDETMSRTAMIEGRWMMTGRLEVRYRMASPVGQTLRVTARTLSSRSRMITATGEVRLAGEPATLIATGEAVFLPVPVDFQRQTEDEHPELAGFFDI
jgi:acyl-coenzyme A thioesterase PaaI-like protein